MLTQWLMLRGKGLVVRTSSLWTKEELKIIQKEWECEILKRCASDYCVSPVQRIGFWGFSDLVWPFGQDLGPVGTEDWGLGLGLDNFPSNSKIPIDCKSSCYANPSLILNVNSLQIRLKRKMLMLWLSYWRALFTWNRHANGVRMIFSCDCAA